MLPKSPVLSLTLASTLVLTHIWFGVAPNEPNSAKGMRRVPKPRRGGMFIEAWPIPPIIFCFSGKRQASLLAVVKCNELIMITGRESCSCAQSVEGATHHAEAGQSKGASRSVRELGSASLNKSMGVASLSEMVKPVWEGKTRPRAPFQLLGVVGDSAHRNNQQELGRPCLSPGRGQAESEVTGTD